MKPLSLISWLVAIQILPAQPAATTVVFVSDGDPAEYFLGTNVTPDDWFEPGATLSWNTGPSGFGPRERFEEVSTLLSFSTSNLRYRFDATVIPETLTLSLKQGAAGVEAWLNGSQVLSLEASEVPLPDMDGFRHYDLSQSASLLQPTGNLLAVRVEGSDIAVPVLHGTTTHSQVSPLGFSPTALRVAEGSSLPIEVHAFDETLSSTRLYLSTPEGGGAMGADWEVRMGGIALPVQKTSLYSAVDVIVPGGESVVPIQIAIIDDQHAEEQESLLLRAGNLAQPAVRIVIPRNDTVVSRTEPMGEGSLSLAVSNAELIPGHDRIGFTEEEGVPFATRPITLHLAGSDAPFSLRSSMSFEGPASPGRITLNGDDSRLFRGTVYSRLPNDSRFEFRRLVFENSHTAIETLRHNGQLIVENCEFIDNGTAVSAYTLGIPARIRNCYFSQNQLSGVTCSSGRPPVIENCTFDGNGGTDVLMSFASREAVLVRHCTFTGDAGGDFVSGFAALENNLFDGKRRLTLVGAGADRGGNLFTPFSPPLLLHPASRVASGAILPGTSGYHGGFTRTIPILPSSPALDLGIDLGEDAPAYDQRGEPFRRKVGPAPDAGAFEYQLENDDVFIGVETGVTYDETTGLYFQFLLVHNTTPWTLSGFRLEIDGLPGDAWLHNGSGDGFIEVAGPIEPGDYQVVTLQYLAGRRDLLLLPRITLSVPSDANLPEPAAEAPPVLMEMRDEGPALHFATEAGGTYQVEVSADLVDWEPACAPVFAESRRLLWCDPSPVPGGRKYYRLRQLE